MIVLIANSKGGVGKSTIATNLVAMGAMNGGDVLLVDTDRQGSASAWANVREEAKGLPQIPTVQKFGNISATLKDFATRYSEIVVDAGGKDSQELRSALLVADRLYVPCKPTPFDVWALETIENLISDVKAFNPKLETFIVFNMVSTNAKRTEIKQVLDILNEFEHLQFSGAILHERVVYLKAANDGLCVANFQDHKAISEFTELYNHAYQTK